jgi:hypothetical protein
MRNPACWPALPGASGGEQHILDPSSTVVWSLSRSASASLVSFVARPPLARSYAEEKPGALTSQLSTTSHLLSTYLHLVARLWLLSPSRYSSAFLAYTHTVTKQPRLCSTYATTSPVLLPSTVETSRLRPELALLYAPTLAARLPCRRSPPTCLRMH